MRTFTIIPVLLAGAMAASAQSDDPLAGLEKSFATKVQAQQKPVTERYLTALRTLRETLTSRGDLAAAATVTTEIELAEAKLESGAARLFPRTVAAPKADGLFSISDGSNTAAPAPRDEESDSIPRTAAGDVRLSPAKATFAGGTSLMRPQEVVQGFTKPGASVTWSVDKIKPGTYDVILDYSSGKKGGGGKIVVTALNAEAEVEITPAGNWRNFRRKRVGGIRVTTPPVKVEVKTSLPEGPYGVLALRQVILRPRTD